MTTQLVIAGFAILSVVYAAVCYFMAPRASSTDEMFVGMIETIVFLLLAIFLLMLSMSIDKLKFW